MDRNPHHRIAIQHVRRVLAGKLLSAKCSQFLRSARQFCPDRRRNANLQRSRRTATRHDRRRGRYVHGWLGHTLSTGVRGDLFFHMRHGFAATHQLLEDYLVIRARHTSLIASFLLRCFLKVRPTAALLQRLVAWNTDLGIEHISLLVPEPLKQWFWDALLCHGTKCSTVVH